MIACKNCEKNFDEKYGVCPACGTPLTNVSQAPYPYAISAPPSAAAKSGAAAAPKKHKPALITAISVSAVVLVSVMILVIMLFAQGTDTTVDEQLSLGEKYLSEENYDEAIVAFKTAIEIDPNDPELCIKLADAYLGKGDTDSAILALEDGCEKTQSEKIKSKQSLTS